MFYSFYRHRLEYESEDTVTGTRGHTHRQDKLAIIEVTYIGKTNSQ